MKHLFENYEKTADYTELDVEGFQKRVPGMVFTDQKRPRSGVPLGGIGTGCLDLDARGVFGWSSIFHPSVQHKILNNPATKSPRKQPDFHPIFGFSIGEKCYIAATEEIRKGGKAYVWSESQLDIFDKDYEKEDSEGYVTIPEMEGVTAANGTTYYGHYPVADIEYSFDDPVSMGVRAWSSFLPGDSAASNIPGAVFEVRLRNLSEEEISGNLAMNFGGPDPREARGLYFEKRRVEEEATGMFVCSDGGVNYFLGIYGEDKVLTGTGLMKDESPMHGYGIDFYRKEDGFSRLNQGLPQDTQFVEWNGARKYQDPSVSVGVPYCLKPGEEKKIEFVLTWYAPVFDSAVRNPKREAWQETVNRSEIHFFTEVKWVEDEVYGQQSHYTPMYAARYNSALDVMRRLGKDRQELLGRILAWQEALLSHEEFPAWTRDALLNNFFLLAENGYWFAPKYPLKDWAHPNGAFVYYESARGCPHSNVVTNNWIASVMFSYFFPDLFHQMLRGHKAGQKENGEIPFGTGVVADVPTMAYHEYYWQQSQNGGCYIMMVYRLWLLTKDDRILEEFYDSIKKAHEFMRGYSKHGWLGMPDDGGSEWYENDEFYGLVSHVGGFHLAQLLIVEKIALHMGDEEYAKCCRKEFEETKSRLEEKLWTGTHYLPWLDEETGRVNDTVMAYQFDAMYAAAQLGIREPIFDPEHMKIALDTIYNQNVKLSNGMGTVTYTSPDGKYINVQNSDRIDDEVYMSNSMQLGVTYMYAGQRERGEEIARNACCHMVQNMRCGWDYFLLAHALDGTSTIWHDYNQNGVVWALPAGMEGGDLTAPCAPGHIVNDVLKAARKKA